MLTMEAWLAELEMEVDGVPSLINNPYNQYQQCETMEGSWSEQRLSAAFGEELSYPYTAESNTSSPDQWDIDNIIIDNFTTPEEIWNNKDNSNDKSDVQEMKEETNNRKQVSRGGGGGAKRKRQPNQVQDHIIAERRRRELLSQLFISLSALVPGLKKMDKTSVLGEAIKHMKQLQEKVKALEVVVAQKTVESVVVVKKSQLVVNDDNDDDNVSSSTIDDNSASGNCGGGNGGRGGGSGGCDGENANDSLPEIEVRISGNTLLLKIYCQNKKGILTKLFQELEKHDLSVTNCSVVPFENLVLDITILTQMQRGFNRNPKNFVRNLRSVFRIWSR